MTPERPDGHAALAVIDGDHVRWIDDDTIGVVTTVEHLHIQVRWPDGRRSWLPRSDAGTTWDLLEAGT